VETKEIERDGRKLIVCASPIQTPADVLGLVAADVSSVLILAEHFPPAFFDLRTGFAGELLQKLENYGVRVAAVFPSEDGYGERFREFLGEARRRGSTFRVFSTRDDAERWLADV
jgi:hypothetical protein